MTPERLKPCPFCGGEAKLYSVGNGDISVNCNGDGCWCCLGAYATDEEATEAWNRRIPDLSSIRAEAMERAAKECDDVADSVDTGESEGFSFGLRVGAEDCAERLRTLAEQERKKL